MTINLLWRYCYAQHLSITFFQVTNQIRPKQTFSKWPENLFWKSALDWLSSFIFYLSSSWCWNISLLFSLRLFASFVDLSVGSGVRSMSRNIKFGSHKSWHRPNSRLHSDFTLFPPPHNFYLLWPFFSPEEDNKLYRSLTSYLRKGKLAFQAAAKANNVWISNAFRRNSLFGKRLHRMLSFIFQPTLRQLKGDSKKAFAKFS